MKITEDLIDRFFEGHCNAEEAEAVFEFLTQKNDVSHYNSEMIEWDKIIKNTDKSLPEQQRNRMFNNIKQAISSSKKRSLLPPYWMAAASVMLFMFAGLSLYFFETQNPEILSLDKKGSSAQQVVNKGSEIMVLTLKDGSKVSLYPHSQISFAEKAFVTNRVINLEGRAVFNVAKDKSRPFTVLSAALSTTALGTIFMVDAFAAKKSLTVQLYEGRVLVRSFQPGSTNLNPGRFMEPNQELSYEKKTGRIVLHTLKNHIAKQVISEHIAPATLAKSANIVFEREPVENVFSMIEQAYGTQLFYKKQAVKNHYFSGVFHMEKDSLERVLRIVSETNHLKIIKIKSGYLIKTANQ